MEIEPKKIPIRLELDLTTKENYNGKFKWIVDLAEAFDAWRIFPRIFIIVYIWLLIEVIFWFMDVVEPSMNQATFVSIVVGAGAAWFGIYTGTGGGKKISFGKNRTELTTGKNKV